jgi:hypothetical protein
MSLTYHPYTYYPWEINPKELKHHYHVQLTPDRRHLVLGMLKQDDQPEIGGWLNVTAIDRDFSKRYFVQYTDFNTLVPGSLIEGNKLPEGHWKEIKRPRKQFHRVTFSDPYTLNLPGGPFQLTSPLDTMDAFLANKANPALRAAYPDQPVLPYLDTWISGSVGIKFNLYYFKGTFAELANDKTKLVVFNTSHLYISGHISPTGITAWEMKPGQFLNCNGAIPDGTYCFILAILNAHNFETDYVVLENILVKTTI